MSGVLVSIKVEDREVKELFARMKERGRDLTPAMEVVGQIIRASVVMFQSTPPRGGRPQHLKKLINQKHKTTFPHTCCSEDPLSRHIVSQKPISH